MCETERRKRLLTWFDAVEQRQGTAAGECRHIQVANRWHRLGQRRQLVEVSCKKTEPADSGGDVTTKCAWITTY